MIWPPVKAWTSKKLIYGLRHFVAINYGEINKERWVVLVSVIDGSIVIKILWTELQDESKWVHGWSQDEFLDCSDLPNSEVEIIATSCTHSSKDSGFSIPLTNEMIRPWFHNG
tara:strand:+ start:191 stop:529 length:339 start_codon:yes stop_codon:yes gene_type:complete